MVVETDDALAGLSLRESLRLRPDVLRRLGWHYLRVHSFELFGNPDAVAARVAHAARQARRPRTERMPRPRCMTEEPRQRVERAAGRGRRARLTPAPGSDPSPEAPVAPAAEPEAAAAPKKAGPGHPTTIA